jgi:hypothetical protein
MTKNPLYNAAAALTYIIGVVTVIRLLGIFAGDKPDNDFLAPIAILSLLVLSATIMAYIFFYQPSLLLLQGKHKPAAQLFLNTVAIFAGFTILVFITMLFTVLR